MGDFLYWDWHYSFTMVLMNNFRCLLPPEPIIIRLDRYKKEEATASRQSLLLWGKPS